MTTPILTIIIPFRKEEETITGTLESIRKSVTTPHVILCIDDTTDPSDTTARLVSEYIGQHSSVQLIGKKLQDTNGFASAIARGIKTATTPYTTFVMADACDDPATIDRMVKEIKKGYKVVSASRYMKGGKKIGGPFLQGLFSRVVSKTLTFLTGIPTTDVSNSFKLYDTKLLKTLRINRKYGVELSMDLIFQAYFKKARIAEIPTTWTGRKKGQSKFRILARTPRYLSIYLSILRGRVRQLISQK